MIDREPWGNRDPFSWWAEQMQAQRRRLRQLRAGAAAGREPAGRELLELVSAGGRLWEGYRLACDWYADQWEAIRSVAPLPLPETLPEDARMPEGVTMRHAPRFGCSCQPCLLAYLHHVLDSLKQLDGEAAP